MAEYINRDEILRRLDECKGEPSELCYTYALYRSIEHIVRDIPAADVAEVKHGEWRILTNCSNAGIYCSECHKSVFKESYIGRKVKYKFCPNCGADMRG